MLNAILNGKGRRLSENIRAGDSVRRALILSEDLLTSTVFERLAYLSGPSLRAILDETFRPRFLPRESSVELLEITFWPTWTQARESLGQAVEPDVVLRITTGDPTRAWTLIVESKLDGLQQPDQWAREWLACLKELENQLDWENVWLLAIGGLDPSGAEGTVRLLTEAIRKRHTAEIQAAAASWHDLLKSLNNIQEASANDRRIIADIKGALHLYNFVPYRPLLDLAQTPSANRTHENSCTALRWPTKPVSSGTELDKASGWLDRIGHYRPIPDSWRIQETKA